MLVVVVDAKTPQDLVFVRRDRTGQSLLGFLRAHTTFLNKGPECSVVEVVDVT